VDFLLEPEGSVNTQNQELLPDTVLIEYICNENFQKPLANIVGK
jgi:hypothetical protein